MRLNLGGVRLRAAPRHTSQGADTMESEKLHAVLAAIPKGHWMSYADVCAAAGGDTRQAIGLNQRLMREQPKNAHRVLKSNGGVADNALGDGLVVRQRLEKEGLVFAGGKADPDRRVRV